MGTISDLKKVYRANMLDIEDRLADFRKLRHASEMRIFEELCFCLLTPGAKAENCKKIIVRLKEKNLLLKGTRSQLRPFLKYARFYDQKASRLVEARNFFSIEKRLRIKKNIFCGDPREVRDWLVKNVSGLGYKESSHFLRNIGLGEELAILDRHILRRLKELGAIKEVPRSLTPKRYFEIEAKMMRFSARIGIPIGHMDLLFFSKATGKPVKYCK